MDLELAQGEIYNMLDYSQRLIASCRVQSAAVVRDLPITPTFQTEERRSSVTPEQRSLDDRIVKPLDEH
jgi:hypothetical protein